MRLACRTCPCVRRKGGIDRRLCPEGLLKDARPGRASRRATSTSQLAVQLVALGQVVEAFQAEQVQKPLGRAIFGVAGLLAATIDLEQPPANQLREERTARPSAQLFQLPVWAALGSRLDQVALPPEVRHVVLFADRGEAGEQAGDKARETFTRQGLQVTLHLPELGDDWNDELRERSRAA